VTGAESITMLLRGRRSDGTQRYILSAVAGSLPALALSKRAITYDSQHDVLVIFGMPIGDKGINKMCASRVPLRAPFLQEGR